MGAFILPAGSYWRLWRVHSTAPDADRPPSYRVSPYVRYPVVYLLHGSPEGCRDRLNLGIAGISDAGVAAGAL
jgi:hypothetical protein